MGDAQSQQQQEQMAADAVAAAGLGHLAPPQMAAVAAGGAGQAGDQGLCESALLSQLVQLLGQRKGHSLLLSDLGALLPGPLRHGVKEKGGLRSWLQKYPQLFQVSGQPGKESVTLLLGSTRSPDAQAVGGDGPAARPKAATAGDGGKGSLSELEQRKQEEDEANESAVQLRGLSYRATVADIEAFLGPENRANLKSENAVQLVLNRDGRPSGFARVQFVNPAAARAARDAKHMQVMEVAGAGAPSQGQQNQERYVEIFLFAERPNKLRFKKTATADGGLPNDEEDIEALGITKEHVIAECREHMNSPGKGQLLLSMLGVALSQGARLYLKKTDQGLKHFLAQYPSEFSVDGPKGRECITFLPAMKDSSQSNRDLPSNFPESQKKNRHDKGTGGPATGSINDIPHENWRSATPGFRWADDLSANNSRNATPAFHHGLSSPKVSTPFGLVHGTPGGRDSTPKGIATPSDWGTPQPFGAHWDPRTAGAAHGATHPAESAGAPFGMEGPGCWGDPMYWPRPPAGMPMNFWGLPGGAAGAPPPVVWGGCPGADGKPEPDVDLGGLPAWERGGGLAPGLAGPPPGAAGMPMPGVLPMDAVLAALAEKMGPFGQMPGGEWGKVQAQAPAEPSGGAAAVRLRGLPFTATEQDIYAFFGKHDIVERVVEDRNAVRMIMKGNGKASGQAVVLLTSHGDIPIVKQVLNGQYMGQRYIEVFQHSEEDEGGKQHHKDSAAPAAQRVHAEAGDTGGSAGSFSQWDGQGFGWGQGAMNGGAPLPPGVGLHDMGATKTNGAGTGDSGAGEENQQEASWEALFGFLKHGQEEAPMPPGAGFPAGQLHAPHQHQ